MNTTNENVIAQTTLEQLGGRHFIAMTGARDLTHDDRTLNMRVGRNSKGVTHVQITLDPSDTYSLKFLAVRGGVFSRVTTKAEIDGVYVDQLRETFERETGLYTRLV